MSALLPKPVAAADLEDLYFAVRTLNAQNGSAFRALRLESLRTEGRVFAASYDEEKNLTDGQWRQRCVPTSDQCWIGIFKQNELIGFTAAMKWDEDPTGKTALFRSSYIRPQDRGKGLSSLLMASRKLWARRDGRFDSAVLFHRVGHWIGKAVKHAGGTEEPALRRPTQWANGEPADSIWYRIKLG